MVAPPGDPQRGLRDLHVARPAARHDRHDAACGWSTAPCRAPGGWPPSQRRRSGSRSRRISRSSDWSAARLSEQQPPPCRARRRDRAPRCADPVSGLEPDARPAFTAQNKAVPIISGMRPRASCSTSRPISMTIAAWEVEQAEAREAFVAATGEDVPQQGPSGPPGCCAASRPSMPTMCPVVAAHQDRHPQHQRRPPEAAGLVRVGAPADRGRQGRPAAQQPDRKLILRGDQPCDWPPARVSDAVRPEVGPHVLPEPEPAGPLPEARLAVIALLGRHRGRRPVADRAVACALSGDPDDAAGLRGGPRPARGDRERDDRRRRGRRDEGAAQGCQAGQLGNLYGQGAKGLRATAWADYDIDLTLADAEAAWRRCAPATPCCCCNAPPDDQPGQVPWHSTQQFAARCGASGRTAARFGYR